MGCLCCSDLGCPVWAALIGPTITPFGLVHGLPTWARRGARGQKNIEPIWAAYIAHPGLPIWAALIKPMWASVWAAHLGLTWSPRPKIHRADMGCLHCSNLGCPVWAALIVPTISPCGLVHGLPTWA